MSTPSCRGRMHNVGHQPIPPPFHPDARDPFVPNTPTGLDLVVRFLDKVIASISMPALSKATLLLSVTKVKFLKWTCPISRINTIVTPLSTRLNRGIAQLSTIPGALAEAAAYTATLRYICAVSFLFSLLVGLVVIAGVPIEFATLCFGGLLLIAPGDVGATRDEENNEPSSRSGVSSALETRNAGIAATLLAS
jgi:hypothetical protein